MPTGLVRYQQAGGRLPEEIAPLRKPMSQKRDMGHPILGRFEMWATRRRLQVTSSAAKLGARVGAIHEKDYPGGICLCIHRREDQRTWRLAREDARESARDHSQGRP